MTLLTIVQAVAKNVGIEPPDTAMSNTDPDCIKLLQFANEAGQEMARRVDWSEIRKRQTIEGTGTNTSFPLAADYARLTEGMTVSADGAPVRGGLSADEWFSLAPIEGLPRYFQATASTMAFYPYPADGQPVAVSYVSKNWTSANKDVWGDDGETALVPEQLIERSAIWRYKRHIGADYSDYLAEFEAMLVDLAAADGGVRQP